MEVAKNVVKTTETSSEDSSEEVPEKGKGRVGDVALETVGRAE